MLPKRSAPRSGFGAVGARRAVHGRAGAGALRARGGTWSTPPGFHGLQRSRRQPASQIPRSAPWRRSAVERVRRAGRVEPAARPTHGRDHQLVAAHDQHQQRPGQRAPRSRPTVRQWRSPGAGPDGVGLVQARRSAASRSPSSSATRRRRRRQGADHHEAAVRQPASRRERACRSRRFTRLRTTAPPTALDTTKPTSGGRRGARLAGDGATVRSLTARHDRAAPAHRREAAVEVGRRRMRCVGGSMRCGPPPYGPAAQAESSARPLRRRAARMARPARVRMRRRKPWVLARRRLFGWKVRLLTTFSETYAGQAHRVRGRDAVGAGAIPSRAPPDAHAGQRGHGCAARDSGLSEQA